MAQDRNQVRSRSKIREVKKSVTHLDSYQLCAKMAIYMKVIGLDTYGMHHALNAKVH